MATQTFNAGVYQLSATKTVVSSLSLSGANDEVVLKASGTVDPASDELTFGLLYDDPGAGGYGPTLSAKALSISGGTNTTFNTSLTAANTKYAIVDIHGSTITFTQTAWGNTTLYPNTSGGALAVGPEHRRKYLLGY